MITSADPINADVAQVFDPATRKISSGRLIARNLLLTARHAVVSAAEKVSWDGLHVRLERDFDPLVGQWPWRTEGCSVVWESAAFDLALVELNASIHAEVAPLQPLKVADASAGQTVRVEARGYPEASRDMAGASRRLTPAQGSIVVAGDDAPLTLGLDAAWVPRNPIEGWPGMSGALVILLDGSPGVLRVYGVVIEVSNQFPAQLRVARLSRAYADPEFRERLTRAGVQAGIFHGTPAWTSAPKIVFGELPLETQRLAFTLFDRATEADDFVRGIRRINDGQAQPPADAVICCARDDTPPHFVDRLGFELRKRGAKPDYEPLGRLEYWRTPERSASDAILAVEEEMFQKMQEPLAGSGVDLDSLDGLIDAGLLKAALVQPGAMRWFYLDFLDASSAGPDDAAVLQQFHAMWKQATSSLPDPRRPGKPLVCGLTFLLHGVTAVPPTLAKLLGSLPVIALGPCAPGVLKLWPGVLEKLTPNTSKAAAYEFVAKWVQAEASRPDFAGPFRLRSLLVALRPTFYADYQD